MPLDVDESLLDFISDHRVAHLATADPDGQPMVIPVCYVFDGAAIFTPIDEKPKSVAARRLKRVRNIESNPRVALIIDRYSEDWSELRYVLISGLAEIIEPGARDHARAVELLRNKYPQYHSMAIGERMIIKITPTRIKRWALAD